MRQTTHPAGALPSALRWDPSPCVAPARSYPGGEEAASKDSMEILFTEQLRDAKARAAAFGVGRFWARTLWDWATTIISEGSIKMRQADRSTKLVFVAGSALLAPAVLAWLAIGVQIATGREIGPPLPGGALVEITVLAALPALALAAGLIASSRRGRSPLAAALIASSGLLLLLVFAAATLRSS